MGGPGGRDKMLAVKSQKIPRKSVFFFRIKINTSGTRGGPGGRDRMLAVKRRKNARIFSLRSFPEVGQKQKTEGKKEKFGDFYFFTKKNDFWAIFILFTASILSRPPGPPAVPGVLIYMFLYITQLFAVLNRCKFPLYATLFLSQPNSTKPHTTQSWVDYIFVLYIIFPPPLPYSHGNF